MMLQSVKSYLSDSSTKHQNKPHKVQTSWYFKICFIWASQIRIAKQAQLSVQNTSNYHTVRTVPSIYNFTRVVFSAWHHATFSLAWLKLCMAWWITTHGKRFCHAKKFSRVAVKAIDTLANIKAMPRTVTHVEETHYTRSFIINWQFVFYRYGWCTLQTMPPMDWFLAAVNSNFFHLQLRYNAIYYNNDFTYRFFMVVSK